MLFVLILALVAVWLIGQALSLSAFWLLVILLGTSAAIWGIARATGHKLRFIEDVVPCVSGVGAVAAGIYVGIHTDAILGILVALVILIAGGTIMRAFKKQ